MASAKYCSSWFKEAGRGHIGALLSWGSFLAYLVLTLMALAMDTDYNFYGIGNQELLYICAGLGTALAFVEFCYLFQPKKLDFYYSLPVRRSTIFWSRYVHGILTFVIPFLMVQGICGIYEAVRESEFLPYAEAYTKRSIFFFLLVFLLFYHAALLAVMVSGKVLASILVLAAFVFYFQVLTGEVFPVFAERLFRTYYRIPLLEQAREILSPLNLAGRLGGSALFEKREIWEYQPGAVPVLAALIFILLFLSASVFAHKSRKTEMTGRSFISSFPEQIAETAVSILGGLFTAGLMLKLAGTYGEKTEYAALLLCGGGLAGALMVHIFIEWLVKTPEESILRRRRQMILEGAGVILTSVLFLAMQPSYDSFKPEEGNLEALSVSVSGLDIEEERAAEDDSGKGRYITDQRLKTYVLKEEGLKETLKWLENLSEGEEIQSEATTATVCFRMKDGQEKYRVYSLDQKGLDSFLAVYGTWEYKSKVYPLAEAEDIQDDRVIWSDGIMEQTLKLTAQEKEEFLQAYKSDIEGMDMSDLYKELPAGRIKIESDIARSTVNTVIYPFWNRTVSFLEKHGVQAGKALKDYSVTGLKIKTSSPQGSKDSGRISTKFYQDKEDISEWTDKLIPKELAIQPLLHPVRTEIEAEAEVEDSEANSIQVIQCFGN